MDQKNVDIYVSVYGSDGNDGSFAAPVQSIERAKELVRAYNKDNNVTVHLAEGTYELDNTLTFSQEDGGQNCHSVTYIGENAVISGGREITGWSLCDAENNIYKAENIVFDFAQLYVNGERAVRAKNVPLNDPYSMRMIKAYREDTTVDGVTYPANSVTVDASYVKQWNNLKDVKLKVLMAWTDNTLPVESVEFIGDRAVIKIQEPASTRVFNRPHPDITGYSHEFTVDFVCWFENAYEFIDEDNEWYLDKTSNTLYYKAPKGKSPADTQVIVPKIETLVSVEGTLNKAVKNLSFSGITFAYSNWTRPNEEGLVGGQASQYVLTSKLENKVTVYRPAAAVSVVCGTNINFESNIFENLGATGLDYYYGNKGGVVEGNIFRNIAGNGINIGKFFKDENTEYHEAYNPLDIREICDGQIIRNNYLTRTGCDYEGSVGIGAGYPRNLTIEHNTLSYMPYTGISVGFGWTNKINAMCGNKILSNHIHDVNMVVCDGAAIYTLSRQPLSEMAYNYVHDFNRKAWFDYGCAGLYLDEQTSGYRVHDNAMYNCPDIWQNQNPKLGNILKNNGAIESESIILGAGVEEKYRGILPESELPKMPHTSSVNSDAVKLDIISTNAPLATDGNTDTAQTADQNGVFVFELDGVSAVKQVAVKKQKYAAGIKDYDFYWTDWIFSVGCEVQGSVDGENWDTIGKCNSWPDGTGMVAQEVFTLDTPKAYKFIRYIRTDIKGEGGYGAWLFPEDNGNRLNLAEIEIYG